MTSPTPTGKAAATPRLPTSQRAEDDPQTARICRNMDLLCGLPDDPFAEED